MTRGRSACLAAFAVVATALPARAELPSDVQRSLQLFEQARKLIDAGNCREAVPKLEESIRYNESVGAHFSLARCAGDPLSAWREYKRAEALAERKKDERVHTAREQATALEPQLALVAIEVRGESTYPDVQVLLDGRSLEPRAYKAALAVEPGKHIVEAFAPKADRRWSKTVVAVVGRREAVVFDLLAPDPVVPLPEPSPPPPPPPPREEPPHGSAQRTVGFVVGGLGLALVAGGAVMGFVSLRTQNDVEDLCGAPYPQCPEGSLGRARRLNDTGHTQATLATVGLAGGAALLVGGAVLLLTAPSIPAKTAISFGPSGLVLSRTW